LLTAIKENLSGKVKDVRLTANFKNYPVCLTASGDVSIEMEKVFNSMPNADGKMKAEKILEISVEHGILDTLKKVYEEDKEKLKKYSVVLYEQARILAGLNIENPTEFVKAFSDII
jgi:molecular chaperone HtpG